MAKVVKLKHSQLFPMLYSEESKETASLFKSSSDIIGKIIHTTLTAAVCGICYMLRDRSKKDEATINVFQGLY